jgi:hypothetical protein
MMNGAGDRVDDDEADLVDGSMVALKVGGSCVEREVPESQVIHRVSLPSLLPSTVNPCAMP